MAKRKRVNRDEPPSDMGLGATLAHMRGDDEPQTATALVAQDDGEGWTVVSASKRRQKERHSDQGHGRRSPEPHSPSRVQHDQGLDDFKTHDEQQPLSPAKPAFDNLFLTTNQQLRGRPSPLENPFSTQKPELNTSREESKKARQSEKHYPAIEHSHHARLQSHVKIADLQSLVLYLLADGTAPQWVSVRSRTSIKKVVMLMVPGLELGMFSGALPLKSLSPSETSQGGESKATLGNIASLSGEKTKPKGLSISPDDFYPATLRPHRLSAPLKPLSDIFEHVWPIKAQGEHRANQYYRLLSPMHSMLTTQIPKTQEEKQMRRSANHKGPTPQNSKHWDNQRTRITEYIASLIDQQENEYVPHPAWFTTPESKEAAHQRRVAAKQAQDDGWVDTHVASLDTGDVPEHEIEQGSVTAGRHVISVDCEMCKAEDDTLVLTRISLMNWDGSVALDKLVKPTAPIKDYLTQWSGITAAMLENVTTTLADIQTELLELITPHTILVGHSLNSDLNALKLTHPFLVDTGLLFPHPRGPPYKQALKWLSQKYLQREIQKGSKGHDSVEDARTCLDLVKQKCEKGPRWGSGDTNAESLFKRLGRTTRPKSNNEPRTGAVIDWGDPNRGHGGQAQVSIGCKTDAEVIAAIDCALNQGVEDKQGAMEKVDFVWARLRELELARGWWDDARTADVEAIRQSALQRLGLKKEIDEEDIEVKGGELGDAVSRTVDHIVQVYESLPRCTAFLVYSGTGDPREIRRLQAMQQQYRREYATKNWDNLSVKWTDTEIQALSVACQDARNGIGFMVVK